MTVSDVDNIIPFPRGRQAGREAERRRSSQAARAGAGRWEIVTPLLGWGGTVLALAAPDVPERPAISASTGRRRTTA
jgi:hypothetical protein